MSSLHWLIQHQQRPASVHSLGWLSICLLGCLGHNFMKSPHGFFLRLTSATYPLSLSSPDLLLSVWNIPRTFVQAEHNKLKGCSSRLSSHKISKSPHGSKKYPPCVRDTGLGPNCHCPGELSGKMSSQQHRTKFFISPNLASKAKMNLLLLF